MFGKKLWNFIVLFILLLGWLIIFAITIQHAKEYILYTEHGVATTGHVEKLYEDFVSSGSTRPVPMIDLTYPVGNNQYVRQKRYNLYEHRVHKERDPYWTSIKVDDPIDVLYLSTDPKQHELLHNGDPRDLDVVLGISIIVPAIIFLVINNLTWRTTPSIYVMAATMFLYAVPLSYELAGGLPRLRAINDGFYLAVTLALALLALRRIWSTNRRGTETTAIITSCDVKLGGVGARNIPYYMYDYSYTYKDAGGEDIANKRQCFMLFCKPTEIGRRIAILYKTDKPKSHLRLRLLPQDS